MTTTYKITDDMIAARLADARSASVEWSGRMPAHAESYDVLANERLASLTLADVRRAVDRNELMGDSAEQEIDMAISIAAEPDGLPENGAVNVVYA